jgi:hypothetical protein
MSHRSTPERIDVARHDAARNRLIAAGTWIDGERRLRVRP